MSKPTKNTSSSNLSIAQMLKYFFAFLGGAVRDVFYLLFRRGGQ